MSWNVTLAHNGTTRTYNTDSLTLDELQTIEQAAGVEWAALSPAASVAQAKAFLVVFALREMTEDQIEEWIDGLTLGELKDLFRLDPSDMVG